MDEQFELDMDDFQLTPEQDLEQEIKPMRPSPTSVQALLLQKITNLQSILVQLVASSDNKSPQQQSLLEELIDTLTAEAMQFPQQQQIQNQLLDSHCSILVNSDQAFDLECLLQNQDHVLTTGETSSDEFISFLNCDLDEQQQQQMPIKPELVDLEEAEADRDALPPGTYDLIELDAMEILAEHTHFCDLCGKGFKRDANLRMHMRGHGDEYKSPAALAKPKECQDPSSSTNPDSMAAPESSSAREKRYSCPFAGCKRHKLHPKFLPLKTVLCVKNHYRRSHCPKIFECSKCQSKRFSVMADLRTHEKHCGREKWRCSCGTSFSRKEKLLGHVSLFKFGHRPLAPKLNVF